MTEREGAWEEALMALGLLVFILISAGAILGLIWLVTR